MVKRDCWGRVRDVASLRQSWMACLFQPHFSEISLSGSDVVQPAEAARLTVGLVLTKLDFRLLISVSMLSPEVIRWKSRVVVHHILVKLICRTILLLYCL